MKYIFFVFVLLLFNCSTDLGRSSDITKQDPFSIIHVIEAVEDQGHQFYSFAETFKKSTLPLNYEVFSMRGKNSNIKLEDDESFSYSPQKHFFGKDFIEVYWKSKSDGKILLSYLQVNVSPREDSPSLFDDVVSLGNDEKVVDVLKNDIDVDGDQLQIISIEDEHENLEVSLVGNKVVLMPQAGFNSQERIQIEYIARDPSGNESKAKILINTPLDESQVLPIDLFFIGSSSQSESGSCDGLSDQVLETLNSNFRSGEQSFVKLRLGSCNDSVVDDSLYIHCDPRSASCNDFDKIQSDYGRSGRVTLVFVNDIQGPVAGIAKMNKLPSSQSASVVAEKSSIAKGGAIYTHEIGHLFGLDHTQQVGAKDDKWILYGSCGQSFNYFQRGYLTDLESNSKYSDQNGTLWDDHKNIMKSEIAAGARDLSFFSDGYLKVFPLAFSCYRARAI